MEFEFTEWKIEDLISLYNEGKLDLNPPYQRGDIWSLPAKKRLIDTIKIGFPLPAFFLLQKEENRFEIVDGQQRTRTILGYVNGYFPDLNREKFENIDQDYFLTRYKLPIIIIKNVRDNEAIEEFYYRVNKFGTKLNRPEILKAQYFGTPLQSLVERIAESEKFEVLNLFTESTRSRMNDLDFIGELLTLIKYGITDKKLQVDRFYDDKNFTESDAVELEHEFEVYLDHFSRFNIVFPLRATRYRQRNDLYSLCSFIKKHNSLPSSTLDYFYKVLVLIDSDISPSNEKCFAFQEYAINCVSQSNSKKAREERLKFFEKLLLNTDHSPLAKKGQEGENLNLIDVMEFYNLHDSDLFQINDFYTLPVTKLNQLKRHIIFE